MCRSDIRSMAGVDTITQASASSESDQPEMSSGWETSRMRTATETKTKGGGEGGGGWYNDGTANGEKFYEDGQQEVGDGHGGEGK